MFLVQRIIYRARVLTKRWMQRNAFLIGLAFGAILTTVVLLIH